MMPEFYNCKSCQTPLEGTYCHRCGQKTINKTLTLKYLLQETASILTNLERGLWFTIRELFLRPGEVIKKYLSGATVRYYNPLRYVVLMSGLAALATSTIDIIGLIESSHLIPEGVLTPEAKAMQQKSIEMTLRYLSLVYLVMLPLYSLGSYIVFRKKGYTYAEHLVANAFLYGQLALSSMVFLLLYRLDGGVILVSAANTLSVVVFNAWVFKNWFSLGWFKAGLKAILALAISYTLIIVVSGIGGAILGAFFPDKVR